MRKDLTPLRSWGAYTVATVNGACVLIVEVAGTRLLAPYFGSGLFVWTSAISVVLGALAVGYFIGSKQAKKEDLTRPFAVTFIGASVLTVLTPYVVYLIGDMLPPLYAGDIPSAGAFLLALLGALLALMPSGVFYGMVGPLIVEYLGRDSDHPGDVAGKVFAVSTIGSIAGTIMTPLFFFPVVGTHLTFTIVAVVMLLLPVIILEGKKRFLFIAAAILAFLLGNAYRPAFLQDQQIVHAQETPYQLIRVVKQPDHYEMIFNAGLGIQTKYFFDKPWTGGFWDWAAMVPYMREESPQDVAMLGFAGGAIPRIFRETSVSGRVGEIDAVDVDPAVYDITGQYFDEDLYNVNPLVGDGRGYLSMTEKTYDIVIMDAYANEYQIPFHLATGEFFNLVRERLDEDGILAFNIALGSNDRLVRVLNNTVAHRFEYVYQIETPEKGNTFVLASRRPIGQNLEELVSQAGLPDASSLRMTEIKYNPGEEIFTDDYAPLEFVSDSWVI